MAQPENLLNFEPWMFKSSSSSSPLVDSWMVSEAFARETDDVLTKALQKSFYTGSGNDEIDEDHNNNYLIDSMNSPFLDLVSSNRNPKNPAVHNNQRRNHNHNAAVATTMINGGLRGKITKRKSRASVRHKTTFINADPENFRQLVQQVTGVKFDNDNFKPSIGGILKPEVQRFTDRSCLRTTTFDSSSFLLDRNHHHHQTSVSSSPVVGGGGEGHVPSTSPPLTVGDDGGELSYDSFSSFPTLESWKVM